MAHRIRRVAVLGAGTMGVQIAAHAANAGLDVSLLDLTEAAAGEALDRAARRNPPPLFRPELSRRITTGSLDDLEPAWSADWVVEAVVEDEAIKRDLFTRIDARLGDDTIVSSNTSGIPIAVLTEGRSEPFQRRFLGTHFFNPPRYLHLVELIPTPSTDAGVEAALREFLDRDLGKGVVRAHDRPGFIANRIGMHGALSALALLGRGEFTVEEIDALTGPLIGRPKSATLRTADIAGLDLLVRVADDLAARLDSADERTAFQVPEFVRAMVTAGRLGEKTGGGFYRRDGRGAERQILALDIPSGLYRPLVPPALDALERARTISDPVLRVRTMFFAGDRVGAGLRATLGATLVHAASIATDVADRFDDVDRAMVWGFGWQMGPFQTLHLLGASDVFDACGAGPVPPAARAHLDALAKRAAPERLPPSSPDILALGDQGHRVIRRHADASLIDLGDGVLAVALHGKLNVIGSGVLELIRSGLDEAETNGIALVIGTDTDTFSAGADLRLVIAAAEARRWEDIDAMVRAFQATTDAIVRSTVPVIAAPAGLCLGGGCEICLHADHVQAGAELYMGLVETSVGLVPAGGGTKEMLLRAASEPNDTDAAVRRTFEQIALARVSTSAADARTLGYLRATDAFTMNRRRVLRDAKAAALHRARRGYQPPPIRRDVPVGGPDMYARLALGAHLAWRAGRATEHDAHVARKLAWILSGGDVPHRTAVTETRLLDLEREAFLSLCGEAKTIARMTHTLRTGKPLRN